VIELEVYEESAYTTKTIVCISVKIVFYLIKIAFIYYDFQ